MLCEVCGQRAANVHLTRVVQGKRTESHLCDTCARERGELKVFEAPFVEGMWSLPKLLAGIMGQAKPAQETQVPACPTCGLPYEQFARTGLLGCAGCYDAFRLEIEPVLRRVHGAVQHAGKVPDHTDAPAAGRPTGEALRDRLRKAIEEEAYEEAARIRDELRRLESQSG